MTDNNRGISVALYGIPVKLIVMFFSATGFFFGMLVAIKHPEFARPMVDGALFALKSILQVIVSMLETTK